MSQNTMKPFYFPPAFLQEKKRKKKLMAIKKKENLTITNDICFEREKCIKENKKRDSNY